MSATAEAESVAGLTGAELLDRCGRWIWLLAMRYADRCRLTAADLAHEIRTDVFLHAAEYDPRRGRPTTWVCWRARNVVSRLTERRGRVRRAAQFSQLDARGDGIPAAEGIPCPRGEDTPALELDEDRRELSAAVADALTYLTPGRRAAVVALAGLDGSRPRNGKEYAAERGVTRERVRQLKDAAVKELRAHAGLRRLADVYGLDPDADHTDGVLVGQGCE